MARLDLTVDAPFLLRFVAYLKERFPPVGNILLIISYYSSNQFLAQALLFPEQPLRYSSWSIFGAISVLCSFFYLRVFDEHKDYEEDKVHYPDRLLSRGVVTLHELRRMAILAIALQLGICLIRGSAAFAGALLVLGFALLMLKEFFVGGWLRRHFLLYAVSHMLIMPLYALQIFSFTTNQLPFYAPVWYWAYAFVGLFVTFNWEISRKIRAPQDERSGIETYSKIFGTYGACYLVLGIRVIDTLLVAAVGYYLSLGWSFYALLALLYFICLFGFLRFRLNTNSKTAASLENYAAIYIVAFDIVIAAQLINSFGIIIE